MQCLKQKTKYITTMSRLIFFFSFFCNVFYAISFQCPKAEIWELADVFCSCGLFTL